MATLQFDPSSTLLENVSLLPPELRLLILVHWARLRVSLVTSTWHVAWKLRTGIQLELHADRSLLTIPCMATNWADWVVRKTNDFVILRDPQKIINDGRLIAIHHLNNSSIGHESRLRVQLLPPRTLQTSSPAPPPPKPVPSHREHAVPLMAQPSPPSLTQTHTSSSPREKAPPPPVAPHRFRVIIPSHILDALSAAPTEPRCNSLFRI